MTSPAQQLPADQHDTAPAVAPALVAAVAAVLVAGGVWKALTAPVAAVFRRFGAQVDSRALAAVLKLTDGATAHLPRMRGRSDLMRGQRQLEAQYRAAYVVRAAGRVGRSLSQHSGIAQRELGVAHRDRGVAHSELSRNAGLEALRVALGRERVYLDQHRKARARRLDAAQAVAAAADRHGPVLSWRATLDAACTPECRAANGSNFRVDDPPVIGWPGTPHGGTCRCVAGAPRPGAPWVNDKLKGIR